jgi:5-methylcytosine-specific restriction endonuclease McrA
MRAGCFKTAEKNSNIEYSAECSFFVFPVHGGSLFPYCLIERDRKEKAMQKTTYERYTVDVFTDKKRPWMEKYSIREMSGPHGAYFSFQHLPSSEAMAIERNSHRYHIKTRKYEDRWGRSRNYRDIYFASGQHADICPYCGHRIEGRAEIDHIVPVAKLKKSGIARMLLSFRGIHDANDPRNLVAVHPSCNRRKGDRLGPLWYARGLYGKHEFYWKADVMIRALAVFSLMALAAFGIYTVFGFLGQMI